MTINIIEIGTAMLRKTQQKLVKRHSVLYVTKIILSDFELF